MIVFINNIHKIIRNSEKKKRVNLLVLVSFGRRKSIKIEAFFPRFFFLQQKLLTENGTLKCTRQLRRETINNLLSHIKIKTSIKPQCLY